jgi:putative hydrolase of the HAD superfamily
MMYRAVLFDLGNTLVKYYRLAEFPAILRRCLARCQEELGVPRQCEEKVLLERAERWTRERSDDQVYPLAERLADIFRLAPLDEAQTERLCAAFLQPIFELALLDPSALRVLKALRSRGVRTGLISNTPWGSPAGHWRAELDRHGLTALLDVCVFCADVGYRKPHPAPFRRALELLSLSPEQCLFVGDDPDWDVRGARSAGLSPVILCQARGDALLACPTITRLDGVLDLLSSAAVEDHCPPRFA